MRIPFGIQANDADAKAVSAELALNCFVQIEDGGKNKFSVRGIPGIVTQVTLPTYPHRGHIEMGGALYAVYGQRLYRITRQSWDAGTYTTDLGSIPGIDRVVLAQNGSQVAIAANGVGYIATSSTVTAIADSDFTGRGSVSSVDHLDGYFIWSVMDSDIWFWSNLNDGTLYDSVDQLTAESETDAIVRIMADAGQIWLVGSQTTENYINTGATVPFERNTAATLPEGGTGKHTIVKLDNTIMWVNDDGIVQRLDVRPIRISNHSVEADLAKVTENDALEAWGYVLGGHAFYVLSYADAWTWVFDAATGKWHKRQSGSSPNRWNASGTAVEPTKIFGKWIVGHPMSGKLGYLDAETYTEWGDEIIHRVRSQIIHRFPDNVQASRLSLDMAFGEGLTTGQGSDPKIMFRYSDDQGRTWSKERQIGIGAKGKYQTRVDINRLPLIKRSGRVFELSHSDPTPFVMIQADLNDGPS